MQIVLIALVGAAAGVLSVLLGVGGGIIMVPAMVFLSKDMTMTTATATSLAVIVPTAIVGAMQRRQEVDWRVAALLVAGSIIGVLVGHRMGKLASETLLKQLFAGLMIVTAIRMLLSTR